MEFTSGEIEGVTVEKLVKHVDERGFLIETFRKDTLPGSLAPQMGYVSYTEPEIARGPHEHREQTDIFAFIGPGNFRIHLWDNRSDSPTGKNRMIFFGGEDDPLLVVVPPGVVHGYKNMSRTVRGMVLNYPDRLYRGLDKKEEVDEIRHED
ncbi:MAG TPA: dTDP-4-dehydrorhamnose 3,5-epimerase, partial [Spirochaetes bacterium]|nr:dTDP-4-dehydrorhamnose 3,5-epimerase [Spirochaetota bacterium]